MPSAAFEEAVFGLMQLGQKGAGPADGALARMLAEDLVALAGVRLPQLPSSRPFGTWPAANPREYLGALPTDPSVLKVVPVPPRPFPPGLRDADLLPLRGAAPLADRDPDALRHVPIAWLAGAAWRALRRARPRGLVR